MENLEDKDGPIRGLSLGFDWQIKGGVEEGGIGQHSRFYFIFNQLPFIINLAANKITTAFYP